MSDQKPFAVRDEEFPFIARVLQRGVDRLYPIAEEDFRYDCKRALDRLDAITNMLWAARWANEQGGGTLAVRAAEAEARLASARAAYEERTFQWEKATAERDTAEADLAKAREAHETLERSVREYVRLLDEKYVRVANECARAVEDGDLSDYVYFEEGRREAFKWAAEKARAALAVGEAGTREQDQDGRRRL